MGRLLLMLFKLPKLLIAAASILLLGSMLFNWDFISPLIDISNFVYVNKVIRIIGDVIEALLLK